MTLTTTQTAVAHLGDGSTTAFAVPFAFFGGEELEVVERDLVSGAESVKAAITDYAVSGGDGAGGSVLAVAPPPAGVAWHIRRRTAPTQQTDYVENDAFAAASHERALDRLAAGLQEVGADLRRAALLPRTAEAIDVSLPEPIAGRALRWNDSGSDLCNASLDLEAAIVEVTMKADEAVAAAAAADGSSDAAGAAADSAAGSAAAAAASAAVAGLEADKAVASAAEAASFAAAALLGTSASNVAVGTGSRTFVTQEGKAWGLGMRLRAASADGLKCLEGAVTAYAAGSLTLAVDYAKDGGSHADWYIGPAGARGAQGASGTGSGDMVAAQNLADVADPSAALANIGGVPAARNLATAGGLAGGGSLAADRTLQIADDGVTLAKLAHGSGGAYLGYAAGGAPEEKPAPALTKAFESGEIACTSGLRTAAHGLGGRPLLSALVLRCKTADAGYGIGDEIDFNGTIRDEQAGTATNHYNGTWGADATHCFVNYRGSLYVRNKSSGALGTIDNARWRFVFRAFA